MNNTIIQSYCPQCEQPLTIMDKEMTVRCPNCNTILQFSEEKNTLVLIHQMEKKIETRNTLGKKRQYFWYLLLGIGTLGIGFIFYLLKNLEDLNNHEIYPEVETGQSLILIDGEAFPNLHGMFQRRRMMMGRFMAIFILLAIPYDLFMAAIDKYSVLFDHLKNQSKETAPTKSPHPTIYTIALSSFLLSTISTIVLVVVFWVINQNFWIFISLCIIGSICCLSFIGLTIIEALWQKAFNDHIRAMNKLGIY
ncbi:MAG: hypothetical protein GF308_17670 [Candidatus Heimdallarchaeota archaeon]|nr:hypothetical protein [Candidatus Heimdallarchaeota archaeon]